MAIADAIDLAGTYRISTKIPEWLLEFSRRRMRCIQKVVTESLRLGALVQGNSALTRFARNHVLPWIPITIHDAQMRKLLWFNCVQSVKKGDSQEHPHCEVLGQIVG